MALIIISVLKLEVSDKSKDANGATVLFLEAERFQKIITRINLPYNKQ